jgi:hypothetical protein
MGSFPSNGGIAMKAKQMCYQEVLYVCIVMVDYY